MPRSAQTVSGQSLSIPDWLLLLPWDTITQVSNDYKLDRKFIGAVCYHESLGIPSMTRFESTYRYLYFPERYAEALFITEATETNAQKTSYGLCQIMGAVARELGYADHLSRLSEPRLGLDFGCRKMAELKQKYGGELSEMAAAYNSGNVLRLTSGMYFNQKYVDAVMGLYRELI